MSNFFSAVRGFGRSNGRPPQQQQQRPNQPGSGLGTPSPQPDSPMGDYSGQTRSQQPVKNPIWYQEKWTQLSVKGNFMTIIVRPKMVDDGEWVAHQFNMLKQFAEILLLSDPGLPAPCNPMTCPEMSAGAVTYTWLDHNRIPTRMPAAKYIELVLKWIESRIDDTNLFPTDPNTVGAAAATYPAGGVNTPHANIPIAAPPTSINAPLSVLAGKPWLGKDSGFPENFENEIKNIMRLMFRVYAHIYWSHFVDPFYHLNLDRAVNAGFMYFLTFANEFDLLTAAEVEPMQKLIDIWTQTHQNFNPWGVKSASTLAAKDNKANLAVPNASSSGAMPQSYNGSQGFSSQNITPQGYTLAPQQSQGFSNQAQSGHGYGQPMSQAHPNQSGGNTPMGGMTPPTDFSTAR